VRSLHVVLRDGDLALLVDFEGNELAIDRQRERCLKLWQGEGVDECQALNEGASDGRFEVVSPSCDLTVGDVEDTHDWHR
jgi:hypothetical protein